MVSTTAAVTTGAGIEMPPSRNEVLVALARRWKPALVLTRSCTRLTLLSGQRVTAQAVVSAERK